MFRLACFRCLHVLLFRLNALLLSVCSKDSLNCFADSWKEKRDWCVRGHFRVMKFYNFLYYFFFLSILFFYPRHSPTPTTHTYYPHPRPTTHYPHPRLLPTTLVDLFTCGDIMFSHESSPDILFLFIYITIIHDLSHTFF